MIQVTFLTHSAQCRRWRPYALSLLIVVLVLVGAPSVRAARLPGIYLNGPRTIDLNTAYTYQVKIIPNKSYAAAVVWVYVLDCSQRHLLKRLMPRKSASSKFVIGFSAIQFHATPGITASIVVPGTKNRPYWHVLYHRYFPVTLATSPLEVPLTTPTTSQCVDIGN